MASKTPTSKFVGNPRKKTGKHSKKKHSSNKRSKNYKKKYVGQGR